MKKKEPGTDPLVAKWRFPEPSAAFANRWRWRDVAGGQIDRKRPAHPGRDSPFTGATWAQPDRGNPHQELPSPPIWSAGTISRRTPTGAGAPACSRTRLGADLQTALSPSARRARAAAVERTCFRRHAAPQAVRGADFGSAATALVPPETGVKACSRGRAGGAASRSTHAGESNSPL